MAAKKKKALALNSILEEIDNEVNAAPTASALGWELRLKALQCVAKMKENFNYQYTWIDEALIEAKKTFASPKICMIPKTPSASRSRKVMADGTDTDNDSVDFEKPAKKIRTVKKIRNPRKKNMETSQEDTANSDTSMDLEHETSASESCGRVAASSTRSTRSARNSKNTTSGRATRSSRRNPAKSEASEEDSKPEPVLSLAALEDIPEVVVTPIKEDKRKTRSIESKKNPVKNEQKKTLPDAQDSTVENSLDKTIEMNEAEDVEKNNDVRVKEEVILVPDSETDEEMLTDKEESEKRNTPEIPTIKSVNKSTDSNNSMNKSSEFIVDEPKVENVESSKECQQPPQKEKNEIRSIPAPRSPVRKAQSPCRKAQSPCRKAQSPCRKAQSPCRKAQSPLASRSPKPANGSSGYLMMNVKQRASRYEEMVRSSMGSSREASPVGKHTPNSRLANRSINNIKNNTSFSPITKTSAPSSPNITPNAASTPDTAVQTNVSCAAITLAQPSPGARREFETKLGSSPAVLSTDTELSQDADNRRKSRRSSTRPRVSGSKVSASKRRSSIFRHKERTSVSQSQLTHLQQIKARLMNASQLSNTSDVKKAKSPVAPVRSTRSKARPQNKIIAQSPKVQTPDKPPRSKLKLNKVNRPETSSVDGRTSSEEPMDTDGSRTPKAPSPPRRTTRSKVRQNKPPPTLPVSSDSDSGTPTATSDGHKIAAPPSLAPVRSTRSKMRQLQQQDNNSSPYASRQTTVVRSDSGKRPRVSPHRGSPPKRQCLDSEDDDAMKRTPSPARVSRPVHANSFLNQMKGKARMTPNNLNNSMVTSFLQRNTPTKKPTTKELIDQRRKQLLVKEKQEEDRLHKRQEVLQKRAEEQRRKREDRQLQVAKRREEQLKKEQEAKKGFNQKFEEKKNLTQKILEEKQKEEREKQRLRDKKMVEAEMRRNHEEEARLQKLRENEQEQQRAKELQLRKKEYEEQERLRRIAEQRRLAEEKSAEAERERQREADKLRHLEEQRLKEEKERQREKEERERKEKSERERHELERQRERERQRQDELDKQREIERQRLREVKMKAEEEKKAQEEERRLQRLIEKHNHALQQNQSLNTSSNPGLPKPHKPTTTVTKEASHSNLNSTYNKEGTNLNSTYNKDTSINNNKADENQDSYDMTPVRKVYKPAIEENDYNINELHSDDSTDDEEAPRKRIPQWATGPALKAALITQYYNPPDLDNIFDVIEPPDLCKLFTKKKATFYKRTSSAVWHSPMYLPSGKPVPHT